VDPVKLVIDCDDQASQDLRAMLGPDDRPQFIERRNLSGDAAAWIVIATLAVRGLPHILDFLIKWRELSRVKRIKIGEIEIENPSSADLVQLRTRLAAPTNASDGTT
jgi:hypothetical protein